MSESGTTAESVASWWDKNGLWISGLVAFLAVAVFLIGAYRLGSYCSVKHDQKSIKEVYQKAVTASKQFENEARATRDSNVSPSTFTNSVNAHESEGGTDEETDASNKEDEGWWQSFSCEIKITDFFIVAFTLALVIVTYFLWYVTHRLWKSGELQIASAMIAAKAAQSQAETARREFLLANRPSMYI